ncbi:MAG: ABC transporter permease [Geothrix sp.]|nr:ABC transporter permease [Geothrix sp.]
MILGLLIILPFAAYLAWLVWALVAYPVPLSYNLRSLWQRKLSSLSTAAAIALVVGIFVVVLSLAQGLSVAFVSSGRGDQAIVLRPNARFELNSSIERDRMRILKIHPLLKRNEGGPMASAEVVVVKLFPMVDGTDTNVTVRGLERMGITLRPQVRLLQGRWFRPGLSEVVVPRRMQGRFPGMELGRSLRMGGRDWQIVGTFDAGGASYESEVWSDVNDVMQAFRRESYSAMLARLENSGRLEGFGKAVEDDKRLKLEVVRETDYFKELTKAGDPIKVLGNLITLILTGAAIFAAMNTMYAAVAGRTREIGTLRALGFRQREILASFQWESIFLCLTGGILGSGLALFANGIQTGTTSFETFSDVSFAFTITPALLAQGVAFSLVMGLLGGFLPAWRASRIPLTEAMKGG